MGIVLAAPAYAPPIPLPPEFTGVTHEWIGWDGTTYDLNNWRSGLCLDDRGVEGLHFPVITKHKSKSQAVHGAKLRGWRAEERDVFWPIQLWSDAGSDDWLTRMRAFFKTIHPGREGVWRVTAGGQSRELRLTGVFTDPHVYDLDPMLEGWSPYGIRLEAVQPYWAGPLIQSDVFRAPEPVDFIQAPGGPPFHRSSVATFASASIANPGDVEAWPVWRIRGPLHTVSVGVGGRMVNVPFPVEAGETLLIDTDPRNVTATLDGVNATRELGFQRFAAVPDGASSSLDIAATGTGDVTAMLTPLFLKAL